MPKATQPVGKLEHEPKSAQALFFCIHQASVRATGQVTVHTPSRNGILSVGVEIGVDSFA